MIEIERKYLDANLNDVRARLTDLGAKSAGPHFEKNTIFDHGDALFRGGRLLRLRLQEWPGREQCVLAFKSPFDGRNESARSCKFREELEVNVDDFQNMSAILCKLGYSPMASYEKVREAWVVEYPGKGLAPAAEMTVDLDFLPFCQVVEIEGDPDCMDGLAVALGLDKKKISTKTYHELYQKWLLANGLPPTPSFVFDAAEKKRLRSLLGLSH